MAKKKASANSGAKEKKKKNSNPPDEVIKAVPDEVSEQKNETLQKDISTSDDTEKENTPVGQDEKSDNTDNETSEFDADIIKRVLKLKSASAEFIKNSGLPELLLIRFMGIFLLISGFMIYIKRTDTMSPINNWREFSQSFSFGTVFLFNVIGFIGLTIVYYCLRGKKYNIADHVVLFLGFLFFSCCTLYLLYNFYLAVGLTILSLVLMYQILTKKNPERLDDLPDWTAKIIILVCTAAVTAFIIVTSINRYRIFWSSTFDFGIFVQMFYSMSHKFLPLTTCERGVLLSHFNVHASYILYLLVPVYKLIPRPETLLAAQPIIAMSGVIPLYLIAKNHKYKGLSLASVCLMFVFSSGIIMPCFYDFHENCFLPPLLLWTIYAVDKRKYPLMYIMSALVCIVKEDAPLYIICLCVFLFFDEKSQKRFHAVGLASLSVIYFAFITGWLNKHGDGQMMAQMRFANLTISPEDGFAGIVKNVLMDPAYFFSLLITDKSLMFFAQVFVPLLFIPFMTKKAYRLILIFPFVIMNLAVGSTYGYASDISYQYIFGPASLLMYLVVINCADTNKKLRNTLIALVLVSTFITSFGNVSSKQNINKAYKNNTDYYDTMAERLDEIPSDASVMASAFYTPQLSNRDNVRLFDINNLQDPFVEGQPVIIKDAMNFDFFVIRTGDEIADESIAYLKSIGFTEFDDSQNTFVIYKNPDYSVVK